MHLFPFTEQQCAKLDCIMDLFHYVVSDCIGISIFCSLPVFINHDNTVFTSGNGSNIYFGRGQLIIMNTFYSTSPLKGKLNQLFIASKTRVS